MGLIVSRLEKSLVGGTAAVAWEGTVDGPREKFVEWTGGGGCESIDR